MSEQNKKQPLKKLRVGNVVATVWENQRDSEDKESRSFHSVRVEKIYKNDGKWASSQSFDRDDLPKLKLAIEETYRWFFENQD
jgi:hypothetical protein